MTAIHFDARVTDDERRRRIYAGDLFVLSPTRASRALCDFAREMLEDTFAPHDPRQAQFHMPVEEFVERFAPVKPAFIHHPETKGMIRDVLTEAGCDLELTYLDVPRLRGVTSHGYLTAGVGYAHHPHRDTWYSAPLCQLNWWLPIYEFGRESTMAFHSRYWSQGIRNGSAEFNYYEWNAVGRREAAKHVAADTRKQPKAEEPLELEPQVRVVCAVGGILLFSGAQLHSTVPNTSGLTRFSIDFRSVHRDDVAARSGAPNVDSHPTGTSLRDFLRAGDLTPLPDELVALYDDERPAGGELVFRPAPSG